LANEIAQKFWIRSECPRMWHSFRHHSICDDAGKRVGQHFSQVLDILVEGDDVDITLLLLKELECGVNGGFFSRFADFLNRTPNPRFVLQSSHIAKDDVGP